MTFVEWLLNKGISTDKYKRMNANTKHALLKEYLLTK